MKGAAAGGVALTLLWACGDGERSTPAPLPSEGSATAQRAPPHAGRIRILYDRLRAPHIFAPDEGGALFGLGYAQVLDFPVATLAALWSTSGRFAEVAGPRALGRDLRVRVFGIDELAHRQAGDETLLDPWARSLLSAYVDGVNAGRRFWLEHPEAVEALVGAEEELWLDPVPPWLNPMVSRLEPLRVLQHLLQSPVGLEHVLCLGVAFNAGPEFIGGGFGLATNVWTVRGTRDHPGLIGLMDAHQPIKRDGDLRSYLVQLEGGELRWAGISMPGWPCIFSGFNDRLFYGLSTPPKVPSLVRRARAPFRLDERAPHAAQAWVARLEPPAATGGEPALRLDDGSVVPLERHEVHLRFLDPESGRIAEDPRGPRVFYRVPSRLEPFSTRGVGWPVVEPAPGVEIDPERVPTVRFEGRTFLAARNALETLLNIARTRRVGAGKDGLDGALRKSGLSFGRAEILLAGDVEGGLESLWLAQPARPGSAARESGSWGRDPLDGNRVSERWEGLQGFDDLPRIAAAPQFGDKPLVWLNCNSSPHYIRPGAPDAYAYDGPRWVFDDEPWATVRHGRARELFDRAAGEGSLALADVERIALDVQDVASVRLWPYLAALRRLDLTESARRFLDWIEQTRYGPARGGDGAEPFLATTDSRIMPFLVLLRLELEERTADLPDLTLPEVAFVFDPVAPLPEPAEFLHGASWARLRRLLCKEVEDLAALREATLRGRAEGLSTRRFLAGLKPCDPVLAPVWPTEPPAAGEGGLPTWGEVHPFVATAHVLPWPIAGAQESWLRSLLSPCSSEGLAPFYRSQRTAVGPVPGTRTSIFHAHWLRRPGGGRPRLGTDEGALVLLPVDFGSQVLFAVELRADGRPRARALPAFGATEILTALPGHGRAADDHFAPLAGFLAGRWSDFLLDEAALEARAVREVVVDR